MQPAVSTTRDRVCASALSVALQDTLLALNSVRYVIDYRVFFETHSLFRDKIDLHHVISVLFII